MKSFNNNVLLYSVYTWCLSNLRKEEDEARGEQGRKEPRLNADAEGAQ